MSDYIKREDAINVACGDCPYNCSEVRKKKHPCMEYKELMAIPSADVAPFNHGHWIKHEGRNGAKDSIECSACGVWIDDMPRKTFCPNCGSIMYRYGEDDEIDRR